MRSQRFGARVHGDGTVFRVWAPAQSAVSLVLDGAGERAMRAEADGFFEADVPGIGSGQRYWFRLGERLLPDPASRFQPDGPLGASEVIDASGFPWTDRSWQGVPIHRQVIYEMHIGTFTQEGTWHAARVHLPRLVDTGITTLEVMPIAEFAGRFGWGYDGVDLFAPAHIYGSPDDARRFVDEAHRLGLAVILDVVYNHFGPVGNFIREYSPTFLGGQGEWGDSINYEGPGSQGVRAFMIENASYWIEDFHFDGLRLDATQAIQDRSEEHIVSELCRAAREAGGGRTIFLVGESETQDTRLLRRSGVYRDGLDALWSEDWHHAAFVALTGRREAYFTDYRGTAPELASMARHGTLYQGQWYTWQSHPRGGYALNLPPGAFVNFLENHDQVANTGLGTRLQTHVDAGLWRALSALLLLGPALPMLFQGQEFGSTRPFTYFADHDPELNAAVQAGRATFLRQFPALASAEMQARLPDPSDPETFRRCRLDDDERTRESTSSRLYRDLLRIRRDDEVLSRVSTDAVRVESSAPTSSILLIRYIADQAHRLLLVNLRDDDLSPMNDPLFAPAPGQRWELLWTSEHPDYGGGGAIPLIDAGRWLIRGLAASLLRSSWSDVSV
jgi:maltooligosyltrehalose trehalohydrolase